MKRYNPDISYGPPDVPIMEEDADGDYYLVEDVDKKIAELEHEIETYKIKDKMRPLPMADCGGCRDKDEIIKHIDGLYREQLLETANTVQQRDRLVFVLQSIKHCGKHCEYCRQKAKEAIASLQADNQQQDEQQSGNR